VSCELSQAIVSPFCPLPRHRPRVIVTVIIAAITLLALRRGTTMRRNSLLGELNICGLMAGISNDGGDRTGMTGGDPINGDMPPNEAFPGWPGPFCGRNKTNKRARSNVLCVKKKKKRYRPVAGTRRPDRRL